MSNPIFFIDGQTERKIIQKLCPNKPVRITGLNGKSVTIKAIAQKLTPLIKVLGGKFYPIIILIDKEQRHQSFQEIADELKSELENKGLENEDLRVGVADRMIENWILADWESLAGNRKKNKDMEGTNGTSEIKKVKGRYDKTTDGVECFISARQSVMYQNSISYRHFIDQLDGIECHYLDFEK